MPILLLVAYAAIAAVICLALGWLRHSIPLRYFLPFALLPIALVPESFVTGKTHLPIDVAGTIPPWNSLGTPAPRNPALSDVALQFVPWSKSVRLAYKAGELPWRDRWNGSGSPLAANGSSGAFSPFTIAGLLLPFVQAFALLAAAKVLLAMAGMWLWTRELGASAHSAGLAALSFGLSFSVTAWLLFPQTAVLCLWPWMLFLMERGRGRANRLRASVGLVLCFCAMVLAGHPENVVLGCVFAGLWLTARALAGRSREDLSVLGRTASLGLIAAGLTAWLLLPQFHAIAASNRYALLESRTWDRFLSAVPHGPAWAGGFLVPLFPFTFGDGIASPMIPGGPSPFLVMGLAYIGVLGWAVALLVFRSGSRRSPQELALWLVLVLGLALAVGQWPFLETVAKVPLLGLIAPLRFLSWVALTAPAIAALELDRYHQDLAGGRRAWAGLAISCLVLALLAMIVFVRYRNLHADAGGLTFQGRQLLLTCGLLILGALAAFLVRRRPLVLTGLIAVLVAGELLYQARRFYRPSPPAWLFPETPLVQFLRSRQGAFRVLGDGTTLFPGSNVFAGLAEVRTHDPMERRDYVEFLDATMGYDPREYFKVVRNLNAPALDFLNVRYLVRAPGSQSPGAKWLRVYSGSDGTVFENASALPRAFAPRAIRFVEPTTETGRGANVNRRFGASFGEVASTTDWRARSYVLSAQTHGEVQNGPVEIEDFQESTNTVSFRTINSSSRRAFVVVSVTQDSGWTARDEAGRSLPVYWANGPFLAIEVPAGAHAIHLRYLPPGAQVGFFIMLGILGMAGVALVMRGRRKVAQKPAPLRGCRMVNSHPITLRYSFAAGHLVGSLLLVRKALEIEADIWQQPEETRVLHRAYVVSSILSSVAFLEANINEFFFEARKGLPGIPIDVAKAAAAEWDRADRGQAFKTLEKYDFALRQFQKPANVQGRAPYQDAYLTVRLRNKLVHPELENEDESAENYKSYSMKFAPLPPTGQRPYFPDLMLSGACARWAVSACYAFVRGFYEKLPVRYFMENYGRIWQMYGNP